MKQNEISIRFVKIQERPDPGGGRSEHGCEPVAQHRMCDGATGGWAGAPFK
jgi:hypothetical protein